MPVLALRLRGAHHRQDRGDADAARDEDVRRRLAQFEVVAWAVADEFVADLQRFVDVGGTASRFALAQDGDLEAAAVGRVAAQRVLTDEFVERVVLGQVTLLGVLQLGVAHAAEDEVEVRSGGPLGQVCAVGGAQRQEADAVGGVVDPVDDEKRLRLGLSRFRNHACLLHWAQRAVSPSLRTDAPGCICTQGGDARRDVVRVRTSCQSTHVHDGCVTQATFHRRKVFRGRTIWPSVGARRPIAPA